MSESVSKPDERTSDGSAPVNLQARPRSVLAGLARIRGNAGKLAALVRRRKGRVAVGRGRYAAAAILAACLALIALAVLDAPVGAYRRQWPSELIALSRAITDIGESIWYLVPSGLFLIFALSADWQALRRRSRWLMAHYYTLAAYLFLTVAGSGLIATTMKRVIGRARPKHFEDQGILAFDHFATSASYASFPSGHATTVGAVLAVFALIFPAWRRFAFILAIALGSTRILVGAHFPSDVIAGLVFGAMFAYGVALAFARRGLIFTVQPGQWPARHPALQRFLTASRSVLLANVPFLQRFSGKSP